jgi:hypothetical protein
MTCKTCGGSRHAPNPYPYGTDCPDCTPKPFAEVASTGAGRALKVGGEFIDGAYIDHYQSDVLLEQADRINAAVEQREAKLRGALAALSKCVERFAEGGRWEVDHACAECIPHSDCLTPGFRCGRHAALDALGPDAPDYVPLLEHALLMNAFRDLRVVVDALSDESPTERAVLAPFLEAMGVQKRGLEAYSDEQLGAEVKRRDDLGRLEHVFADYEYGTGPHGTSITVTGHSFCGLDLRIGGNWTAVAPEYASALGAPERHCQQCIRAAQSHAAAPAMVQPV